MVLIYQMYNLISNNNLKMMMNRMNKNFNKWGILLKVIRNEFIKIIPKWYILLIFIDSIHRKICLKYFS
jgi:p-aminobenzoyl-glutamate transporter AbgT